MSSDLPGMDLVMVAIFAGAALMVALVGFAMSGGGLEKSIHRRIGDLRRRGEATAAPGAVASVKRDAGRSSIRGLEPIMARLVPRPALLRERLIKTGRRITIGEYGIATLIVGVVVATVCRTMFGFSWPTATLIGVCLGMGLPHMMVGRMINRRLNKFTALFPEAIDLIVRGLRSGLPVGECINTVGTEMVDPVGVEFRRVADAVKLGQTLEEALWDAAKRLDTPEFKFFVISLSVQRETGGNLAETLQNLGDILRKRKAMKLKIKAMSSEAKASAIIIGSLPFIMLGILFLINAGYIMPLFTDPRGNVMVGAACMSLLMGVGVMMKMVRFEI